MCHGLHLAGRPGSWWGGRRGERRWPPALSGWLALAAGHAAEPAPDKSGYHLLHPVPRAYVRELSADRPDRTESPYTVDAGRFQLEMDLLNYTSARQTTGDSDTRLSAWNVAPVNFKVGLLRNADLQVGLESYLHERTEDHTTDTVETRSGFGAVTTRLKFNLWGNDGGATALAVMPWVRWPTASDGLGSRHLEGGVILPLAVALPHEWSMGTTSLFGAVRPEGSEYEAIFINSITFSHAIVGPLDGYLEFYAEVSATAASRWIGTVDVGFTYALTPDIQLDAGVNVGVTAAAEDWQPFAGATLRF